VPARLAPYVADTAPPSCLAIKFLNPEHHTSR